MKENNIVDEKYRGDDSTIKQGRLRFLVSWMSSSLGSIIFHLILLLLLFSVLSNTGRKKGETRNTEGIGIVFSTSSEETIEYDSHNKSEVSFDDGEGADVSEDMSDKVDIQTTIERFLPSHNIGENNDSFSSLGVQTFSHNTGNIKNGKKGQNVGFGGVKGNGKNFVYVIDCSDSMSWNGGTPMRRAISDAVSSVSSLNPQDGARQFQFIFFNHKASVFEQGTGLLPINESNKSRVVRYLNSLIPSGGTAPELALELAIKLKPDVVFFLTDADEELTDGSLERIHSLCKQYKINQICVVEFGKNSMPQKKSFRRLAGENGGAYIFRDIESF